jgi:hypothetical protein
MTQPADMACKWEYPEQAVTRDSTLVSKVNASHTTLLHKKIPVIKHYMGP